MFENRLILSLILFGASAFNSSPAKASPVDDWAAAAEALNGDVPPEPNQIDGPSFRPRPAPDGGTKKDDSSEQSQASRDAGSETRVTLLVTCKFAGPFLGGKVAPCKGLTIRIRKQDTGKELQWTFKDARRAHIFENLLPGTYSFSASWSEGETIINSVDFEVKKDQQIDLEEGPYSIKTSLDPE